MILKYTAGDFETNTYLITENNKALIIDPTLDFKEYADEINSKYDVIGVLLTHAHIDHIDGVKYFLDKPVYISKIDFEHINDGGYNLYGWYSEKLPYDVSKMDIRLLNDNDEIEAFNDKIKCILTPGHTAGSVCYIYKDIIFSGDTLFRGSVGRTDLPGGNTDEILNSVSHILNTYNDDMIIYPGHGQESDVSTEKKYNIYYLEAMK